MSSESPEAHPSKKRRFEPRGPNIAFIVVNDLRNPNINVEEVKCIQIDLRTTLQSYGFTIFNQNPLFNLTADELQYQLTEFENQIREQRPETVLIWLLGHGGVIGNMQVFQTFIEEGQRATRSSFISIDRFLQTTRGKTKQVIVVVDTCRSLLDFPAEMRLPLTLPQDIGYAASQGHEAYSYIFTRKLIHALCSPISPPLVDLVGSVKNSIIDMTKHMPLQLPAQGNRRERHSVQVPEIVVYREGRKVLPPTNAEAIPWPRLPNDGAYQMLAEIRRDSLEAVEQKKKEGLAPHSVDDKFLLKLEWEENNDKLKDVRKEEVKNHSIEFNVEGSDELLMAVSVWSTYYDPEETKLKKLTLLSSTDDKPREMKLTVLDLVTNALIRWGAEDFTIEASEHLISTHCSTHFNVKVMEDKKDIKEEPLANKEVKKEPYSGKSIASSLFSTIQNIATAGVIFKEVTSMLSQPTDQPKMEDTPSEEGPFVSQTFSFEPAKSTLASELVCDLIYETLANVQVNGLDTEEVNQIFSDGRAATFLLVKLLPKWFPFLSDLDNDSRFDFITSNGTKIEYKNFTKHGCQLGRGKSDSSKHGTGLVYMLVDIVDFPRIKVIFKRGIELWEHHPEGSISFRERETIFGKDFMDTTSSTLKPGELSMKFGIPPGYHAIVTNWIGPAGSENIERTLNNHYVKPDGSRVHCWGFNRGFKVKVGDLILFGSKSTGGFSHVGTIATLPHRNDNAPEIWVDGESYIDNYFEIDNLVKLATPLSQEEAKALGATSPLVPQTFVIPGPGEAFIAALNSLT